jgi:hypothetical protein
MKHTLKTQMQVATARARQIARAEFGRRHDAAAYTCHREGASWIAEGAGQRFDFSRTEAGEVLCISASGGIYLLTVTDGVTVCDCPARQRAATCKHETALEAVKMAHRMERIETRTALSAEAAELNALREAGEDAERAVRAEWGSANIR